MGVEVRGTALTVRLADGRLLGPQELVGAVLEASDEVGRPLTVRIDGVAPDPRDLEGEVLLYRLATPDTGGGWQELCGPDGSGECWACRRAVLGFLEEKPSVAIRLIGVLCRKLRRTTEMLEDKTLLSTAPRVARSLLRLAAEHGRRTGEGILVDFKLSQAELGAGLSRENVNRQLGAWRQDGIVSLRGGRS